MRYSPKTIESKWQKRWLREGVFEPDFSRVPLSGTSRNAQRSVKKPYYNLMMFPYPSAEGLHVGNMYAFTGADIYGRFMRMRGYDVFEPIGLDGFGIHSENYALKIGKHPMEQAKISEKNFYRQLAIIGNGFAWRERLQTYDPDYYKWTQWIFVQMFRRELAYRKKAEVNWCPSCKTVLADEQVVAGKCERCGTEVAKRELEQWFFKITEYAERLLKNLEKIDWSEKVKIAQRNWIGRSEGALIKFGVRSSEFGVRDSIEVFTTRPDTLFGATYVVLAPEHPLVANRKSQIANRKEVEEYITKAKAKTPGERIAEGHEKTGVELKGVKAINPANKEKIPVWVSDYVLGNVGTGAIMAVPAHDQRDFEFAKKYDLPVRKVIIPEPIQRIVRSAQNVAAGAKIEVRIGTECWEGEGQLVNSGRFDGMPSEKARWEITQFVSGKRTATYRLRDWLISRQRYWGPPIPMIFCEHCAKSGSRTSFGSPTSGGWIPVPEKDLPVKLPYIKSFRPTGTEQSPLASVKKFYKVRCPKCGSWARRETDVSDTFLDSAWYYLGYLMAGNWKAGLKSSAFSRRARKWLPVDMYIGGAEHSVLHLLYVRFLAMALHDMGFLPFEEPFPMFRAHGLLIKDGAKMSKSRGNVVNPDEYIRAYGADALRMYLMFLGPFEQGGDFRDSGIKGITRFLERVWRFVNSKIRNPKSEIRNKFKIQNREIQKQIHKTIKKITEDIMGLQYNTAISALMILLNAFEEHPDAVSKKDIEIFLKLLAPFAPHIAEELFQKFFSKPPITNHQLPTRARNPKTFRSLHKERWPMCNARFIRENTFELVVQVNGKVRGRVEIPVGAGEQEAKKAAFMLEAVKKYVSGEPRKTIFILNKLINFVP